MEKIRYQGPGKHGGTPCTYEMIFATAQNESNQASEVIVARRPLTPFRDPAEVGHRRRRRRETPKFGDELISPHTGPCSTTAGPLLLCYATANPSCDPVATADKIYTSGEMFNYSLIIIIINAR